MLDIKEWKDEVLFGTVNYRVWGKVECLVCKHTAAPSYLVVHHKISPPVLWLRLTNQAWYLLSNLGFACSVECREKYELTPLLYEE